MEAKKAAIKIIKEIRQSTTAHILIHKNWKSQIDVEV